MNQIGQDQRIKKLTLAGCHFSTGAFDQLTKLCLDGNPTLEHLDIAASRRACESDPQNIESLMTDNRRNEQKFDGPLREYRREVYLPDFGQFLYFLADNRQLSSLNLSFNDFLCSSPEVERIARDFDLFE